MTSPNPRQEEAANNANGVSGQAVEDEVTRMLRVLRRCTCIADYKDRDMRDPECQFCSGFHEEAADCIESLRARAERAEFTLAFEQRNLDHATRIAGEQRKRAEAAEARVRGLEAELTKLRS